MRDMTPAEYREFILGTPRTAMLATVCADGRPHAAPIWIDLDGDEIVFTAGDNTLKVKNIKRDPRIMLALDDEKPPYSYVQIEGVARIIPASPAELLAWATRLAGRYMGPDLAEAFGRRNGVPGELVFRLKPTRIVARTGITD